MAAGAIAITPNAKRMMIASRRIEAPSSASLARRPPCASLRSTPLSFEYPLSPVLFALSFLIWLAGFIGTAKRASTEGSRVDSASERNDQRGLRNVIGRHDQRPGPAERTDEPVPRDHRVGGEEDPGARDRERFAGTNREDD